MPNKKILRIIYTVSLVIALSLFFGLLFGLGYPEIKRAEYTPTTCTIEAESIKPRYCCYLDCDFTCRDASSSAPSCSSLQSRWNAFSPTQCAAASVANSSQNLNDYCPIDGPQAICDNGYYCCSQCCNTCTSCSTSCPTTNSRCSTSCTSYTCNCWCCISTNHQSCQVKCPECYSVELMVRYRLWKGSEIMTSNISVEFDQALNEAQNFLSAHPVTSKVQCYYNPENPLQVLLSVNYSVRTWVLVGLSALILIVMLSIGTRYIFHKVSFLEDINHRIISLQSGLWIGTICPLLFFFLLLVPITNNYILLVLSLCFIAIGWTPLLISITIEFKRKSYIIACFTTLLFFISPIIIFGSTAIYISSLSKTTQMIFIMLAIIIPIGYIVWIIVNWGKLHLRLLELFRKNSKGKENSSSIQTESPVDHNENYIQDDNENYIQDDSELPTYEEAITKGAP